MKLFQAYYLLIFLLLRVAPSKELGHYAKQGCNDTCGNNVTIPYPFGIGAKCAINEWYVVECNSSTPYLHHEQLNRFEIIGVSLKNRTITVNTPKPIFSDCQNPVTNITQTNTINLGSSPFLLSTLNNIFVFEGCGNAVMMDHGSSVVTGCSTSCLNDGTLSNRNNSCFGINCCQTTILRYLKSYNIRLIMDMEKQGRYNACGSAFVMDTSSYIKRSFSNSQSSIGSWEDTFVPISLLWTLSENDIDQVTCCPFNSTDKVIVPLDNIGTSVYSWKCSTSISLSYEGNPYLEDGCYAPWTDVCAKCRANGRYCDSSETIYNTDGSVYKQEYFCSDRIRYKPGKSLSAYI